MLLSAVSVLVVVQSSTEIPEGLMNPVFDGNNRRPPITRCSGRRLNTKDSVNTDHSDGTKMERKRDA